jgi:hypothetical protein
MAAYEAACKRWPGEVITLRQGARIINPRLTVTLDGPLGVDAK